MVTRSRYGVFATGRLRPGSSWRAPSPRAVAAGVLLGLSGSTAPALADALGDLTGKHIQAAYAFTSDYSIAVKQSREEVLRRSSTYQAKVLIGPSKAGKFVYSSSLSPEGGEDVRADLSPGRKMSFPYRPSNPSFACRPDCQLGDSRGSAELKAAGQELTIETAKTGTCRCPGKAGGTSVFTTVAHEVMKIVVRGAACEITNYEWSRSWRGVSMAADEPAVTERAAQGVTTPLSSSCSIVPGRPDIR